MSEIATAAVNCPSCARTYRWKPELAGKKAKCKCGTTLLFPATEPGALEQPSEPAGGMAMEAAAGRPSAPPVQTVPPVGKMTACKGCTAMIPASAVVCTQCGMNQRTGKTLGTRVKGPGPEAADVAVAAGKVVLAMVVGGVAALVGAGIWIGIILLTGYAIGIVAWAIGAGVGFAMRLVNRHGGNASGLAAAGFALFAVLGPKVLLYVMAEMANVPGAGDIFRPLDVLWCLLAMSSAYRLAKG